MSEEPLASIDLPALPVMAHWARRHVETVLGAWQVPGEAIEVATMLASELVANAVAATTALPRSCADPARPGTITQALRLTPGQIVIEVTDPSPNPPVLTDAAPDAESGRGLMLIQALAKEWSWSALPAGGKTVYCACPIEAP